MFSFPYLYSWVVYLMITQENSILEVSNIRKVINSEILFSYMIKFQKMISYVNFIKIFDSKMKTSYC